MLVVTFAGVVGNETKTTMERQVILEKWNTKSGNKAGDYTHTHIPTNRM